MLISPLKNFNKYEHSPRGFTLIEIMVVLAIVAAVVTIGLPRLVSTNTQIRNTLRTMSVVSRRLHHLARINKKTYRLVVQLGEGEPQAFWVESSDKKTTFLTEEQLKEKEEEDEDKKDDEKPKGDFQVDTTVLKKPVELPSKIFFEDVELATRNAVITSGRAYIHFLPQGFVEEAAIHITDKKDLKRTILFHPLTGQSEIIGEYLSIKDLRKDK